MTVGARRGDGWGRERGYVGHVSVSRSVGRFFSPSFFFFTPADFFIRLEGRRPSVTKHCVPCSVVGGGWWGGGVVEEIRWAEVLGAVKQPDWKTVFCYF